MAEKVPGANLRADTQVAQSIDPCILHICMSPECEETPPALQIHLRELELCPKEEDTKPRTNK